MGPVTVFKNFPVDCTAQQGLRITTLENLQCEYHLTFYQMLSRASVTILVPDLIWHMWRKLELLAAGLCTTLTEVHGNSGFHRLNNYFLLDITLKMYVFFKDIVNSCHTHPTISIIDKSWKFWWKFLLWKRNYSHSESFSLTHKWQVLVHKQSSLGPWSLNCLTGTYFRPLGKYYKYSESKSINDY